MKGKFKRRRNGFKKGHQQLYSNPKSQTVGVYKRVVRLDKEVYQEVNERTANASATTTSADNTLNVPENVPESQQEFLSLRPRASKSYMKQYKEKSANADSYMLVHEQKNQTFWIKVTEEHREHFPRCKGQIIKDPERSQKVGTVWIIAAKCTGCTYRSEREKLYEEVDTGRRGRKAAAPNVRLQVALSKNSIGNTGMRHILSTMNVAPPSKSGLRKCSNKVADRIKTINEKAMKDIRDHIKDINVMAGQPAGVIDVEVDGTYNRRFGCSELTPTQPATQTTYLCAENITTGKKIINCKTYSRL